MVDIVTTLIDVLCQMNTQSQCQQFINTYPDVTQQLVWLVFFPSVFIIIFIYLLSEGVVKQVGSEAKKKLQVLVGVAIYMFIIFQGWYHLALSLSRVWFIVIIILSGFFVLIHRMGGAGGSGGGGAGGSRAMGSIIGQIGKRASKVALKDIERQEDIVESALNEMERSLNIIKRGGAEASRALESLHYQNQVAQRELKALAEDAKIGGYVLGTRYNQLEKRWKALSKRALDVDIKKMDAYKRKVA